MLPEGGGSDAGDIMWRKDLSLNEPAKNRGTRVKTGAELRDLVRQRGRVQEKNKPPYWAA
jgi:hypothetical protein